MTAERVHIGTSDIEIAPITLGGNVFGWTADEPTSHAILDAFVAGGGNFIDTADGYSAWVPGHTGGESETVIGSWLAGRGRRDDIVIATKVSTKPDRKGLAPANIRLAADESLARLGTDHIDLYYAHFDDESVPLADTVGALSELVDSGKVRSIGISNYSAERIDEWLNIVAENGLHAPVALQPHYNLVERAFEGDLRERAAAHNLSVFPYFALARGFLSGKYRPGVEIDSPRAGEAAKYLDERGLRVLEALDAISAAHDTSVAAVSLAWLRQQPTVGAPIASARSLEQLPPIVDSLRVELSAAELQLLGAASATA
ncbi:aldo/keto reductase [Mycetocola tolaasinivorans]|uniref:Aldo/keto reductase n=1 Tax=Mycetocola tolaasinivorans TaxID=76635 RepID=A0A3L7A6M3_9MICO|nr:aldo/keto reductase [Mycetocola tolaasinivorans]RLP75500.1 aldo/keto reductase [Mycetocola tolaasinivorans]